MARQRHNAAFVVGSVLGGVAGAAAALWKTRLSGAELRAQVVDRLGGSGETSGRERQSATGRSGSGGVGGKMLSLVERATAPIVGVKLGQIANQAGSKAVSRVGPRDHTTTTPTGDPVLAPHESTGQTREVGVGHVASTDELVTPAVPVEPRSVDEATGSFTKFPEFEDGKQTSRN